MNKTLHFHKKNELLTGKTAITAADIRWKRCDIKATSLLANILLIQKAHHQDANETILIRNGHVTEGGSSNVFVVKNGHVSTPPLSQFILGGVTRDLTIELAEQHKIPITQKPVTQSELNNADEIWITSSTREVFPIVTLDGKKVGNGKPGPLWEQMFDYYQQYVKTF